MTESDIENIRTSWEYVIKDNEDYSAMMMFYGKLFEIAPEAQGFFSGSIETQSKKLTHTISFVVSKIDKLEELKSTVEELGRRHNRMNIASKYYPLVRDALIFTIKHKMEHDYRDEIGASWKLAVDTLSNIMINAPQKGTNKFKQLLNKLFG